MLALDYTTSLSGNGVYTLKITHQTYRNDEFTKCGNTFLASNGIRLMSVSYPELSLARIGIRITVFVLGDIPACDDKLILIPTGALLDKIRLTIHEYNLRR